MCSTERVRQARSRRECSSRRTVEMGCVQGSSPDEVALVDGARALGFEFVGINGGDYTVSFSGVKATFQVPRPPKCCCCCCWCPS